MAGRRAWVMAALVGVLTITLAGAKVVVDGRAEANGIRVAHAGEGLGAVKAPVSSEATASCVNAPAGWLATEVDRVGTDQLPPVTGQQTVGAVVGYLDQSSAQCGQSVGLYLSSLRSETRARVAALRVGAYRGGPLRMIWQADVQTVRDQPAARAIASRSTVVAHWLVSLQLHPTSAWPPGLYLIRITPTGGGEPSYLPLRVKTSGAHAPRMVISSDLTELAYNSYGGLSLYGGPGPERQDQAADRAYLAATDRPLEGSGLGQVFSMEVPLARLLDAHGLAADWTTDSSFDADPAQATGYSSIVLPGHSEYWTKTMYDSLQHLVDQGTNLAALGANEIYWQARLHRDATGRLVGMTVFRDRTIDPVTDRSLVTTQWRDWPLSRDPAALTGAGMAMVGAYGDLSVASTPTWLFRGVPAGVGAVLAGAVGNEADGVEPAGGHSPADVQIIARGEVTTNDHIGRVLVTTSYYAASSGAGVFNAGNTHWLCGAVGACPDHEPPAATSRVLTDLTVNVLTAFATPRFATTAAAAG